MKTIKLPRLFKMKKMQAATARRASAASAGMEFEGIPEPNMKLSRALLIVLLLHVVAVSGIIAFNAIKTRENSFVPENPEQTKNTPTTKEDTTNHPVPAKAPVVAPKKETPRQDEAKSSHSTASEQHTKTPSSSGKTYIVKKGDNPVTIARKLKVSYNDLMALNHIEDARKLRIGQKLQVPESANSKGATAKSSKKRKKSK
ncbi:MAG: LysM peptidoglycan-binding domain-containing protein [Alphaproteobacteria bacterium]